MSTELSPHRPVDLKFHPAPASLKALSFRKPPPFTSDPVLGPKPQQQDWNQVLDMAQEGLREVERGNGARAVSLLTIGYGAWAGAAEVELIPLLGADLIRKGARSAGPQLMWRSV
eukprot:6545187-Pyramimonas_sp.AAC.1